MLAAASAAALLAASPILVLDWGAMSPAEQALSASAQGILAKKGRIVWHANGGIQEAILKRLGRDRPLRRLASVWDLVRQEQKEFRGFILCEIGQPSLSIATSLAGPLRSLIADQSLAFRLSSMGFTITADAASPDAASLLKQAPQKKKLAVEQRNSIAGHLRDFAVRHDLPAFSAATREERRAIASSLGAPAMVLGWGPDEYEWVEDLSRAGATGVAADWCLNLSVLGLVPGRPKAPRPPRAPALAKGRRFAAFVMSDGDNIQWLTGGFATDLRWYGSPQRGRLPITWEVSPLLAEWAPAVLEEIFTRATPNDGFVAGPGLPGYTFPHLLPNRPAQAAASRRFLSRSGLGVASFLNSNDGSPMDCADWMALREVKGGIYKDYAPYNRRKGEVAWFASKPLAAYRFLLWEGLTGVEELAAQVNAMPAQGEGRFALINVHAWSFDSIGGPMEAIARTAAMLEPDVELVQASQLLELMAAERRSRRG